MFPQTEMVVLENDVHITHLKKGKSTSVMESTNLTHKIVFFHFAHVGITFRFRKHITLGEPRLGGTSIVADCLFGLSLAMTNLLEQITAAV